MNTLNESIPRAEAMPIYGCGLGKALRSHRMTEIPSARSTQWASRLPHRQRIGLPLGSPKSLQVTAVYAPAFWAYRFRLMGIPRGRKTRLLGQVIASIDSIEVVDERKILNHSPRLDIFSIKHLSDPELNNLSLKYIARSFLKRAMACRTFYQGICLNSGRPVGSDYSVQSPSVG